MFHPSSGTSGVGEIAENFLDGFVVLSFTSALMNLILVPIDEWVGGS